MRTKNWKLTVAALLAAAGTAYAAPRETVTPDATATGGGVGFAASMELIGDPLNHVATATFTGLDGGNPYVARSMKITGTLTTVGTGTWRREAVILVTPPGGQQPFVIQPSILGSAGSYTVEVDHPVYAAVPLSGAAQWSAAGQWTFQFFEYWNDNIGAADANWSGLTVTLDDADVNLATPPTGPESFTFNNVPSNGLAAAPGHTENITVVGGYTAVGYTLTGTVEATTGFSASSTRTPTGDVRVRVTPPGGTPVLIAPTLATSPSPTAGSISINLPAPMDPAGNWLVEFFEATDDRASNPAEIDNIWKNFTLTMRTADPPAGTFDLGTVPGGGAPVTRTDTVGVGATKWYKFTIGAVDGATGSALDIDTEGTNLSPVNDTSIALYTSNGALVAADFADGSGTLSQLSFGAGTRHAVGDSLNYDGRDNAPAAIAPVDTLPAGTYYLAVTNGDATTYSPGLYGVNNAAANANSGDITVNIRYVTLNGVGSFTGAAQPTRNIKVIVDTMPALDPASTGMAVTADLSGFGLSSTQTLYDDGTNGDEFIGDGNFTYQMTVPAFQATGPVNVDFTVTDAQSRTGRGFFAINVTPLAWDELGDGGGDAGDLPGTAMTPTGSGPLNAISGVAGAADVDMFRIDICDPGTFSATTVGFATWDTQLFLFRNDGTGVVSEDDTVGLQSTLNNALVTVPGPYYLAISRFNSDPRDASNQFLWNVDDNQAPNGPGAANPVANWSGTTSTGGAYVIGLSGVCFFDPTAQTDPTGIASIRAGDLVEQTRSVLFKVAVTPGNNPPSTNITVVGDLSQFGGSATQALFDNQTNGDEVAGDGVYSYLHTIPTSTTPGPVTATFTIADAELRDSTATLNATLSFKSWSEQVDGGGDAGELLTTAQVPTGTGTLPVISGTNTANDADMYAINICDTATFQASLVGNVPTWDTQLWLFNSSGVGVVFNDDDTAVAGISRIDNSLGLITSTGTYYIAISQYNRDPVDASAALLWNNTGPGGTFLGQRGPDGPGAANPIAAWTGGTGGGGAYRINLTGVCYAGPTGCNAADIATAGNPDPQAGPDGFLTGDDFDLFINAFFNELRRTSNNTLIADMVDGDGNPPPDGFLTGSDFDYFLAKFFAGC